MEFREVKRVKQALSARECIEILKNELRGVLAVNGDGGYPYPVPLNHYYCEADGRLYFHSGKYGHKIDALKANDKAAYCVTDGGEQPEGDWALYFKSAVVFGRVEFIEDYDEICRISRLLSLKFTDDENYIADEIAKYGKNTAMFALIPEHITGKRVHEQ